MIKSLFKGCLTIPNLLCVIRIILVPVFAVLFLKGYHVAAIIVLAVSGLTDFFDGKIARRFNQVSEMGKILDPVADKITQITIAVILFIMFHNAQSKVINAFGWVFLVFLAKEAFMVIGGFLMLLFGIKPGAAEMPGKVATMVFYLFMIAIVAFGPEVGMFTSLWTMPELMAGIMVCISAICTLVALFSYAPAIVRQVKERFSPEGKAKRKAEKEAEKAKAKEAKFEN